MHLFALLELWFSTEIMGNSLKRNYTRENYVEVYWRMHASISHRSFQECGAFRNIFFRSIPVNHPSTSILIFAAYVYCILRADAHQKFPCLIPIINHRSVISRDLCSFGRTNFSRTKEKKKEIRPTPRSQYRSRAEFMSDRESESYGDTKRNLCTPTKWMQRYPARQDNGSGTFRRWM